MSPYADGAVWPGVLGGVPDAFKGCVEEPAFMDGDMPAVTFCLWRRTDDGHWHAGTIDFPDDSEDPDGSGWMLDLLVEPTPEAFQSFAEDYYETPVDLEAVRHIYDWRPLTQDVVARLNPATSLTDVVKEAKDMGYPV